MEDKAEQFAEHTGNVVDSSVMKRIQGADIEVVEIPSADIFIQSPTYQRETRDELYDSAKNIRAIYDGIVSSNATMQLTQEQYNKVFNQIEEIFADNPDKLEDIKENWIKFDKSIQHSSLEAKKQVKIVNDFRNMEIQRQELNIQNSY